MIRVAAGQHGLDNIRFRVIGIHTDRRVQRLAVNDAARHVQPVAVAVAGQKQRIFAHRFEDPAAAVVGGDPVSSRLGGGPVGEGCRTSGHAGRVGPGVTRSGDFKGHGTGGDAAAVGVWVGKACGDQGAYIRRGVLEGVHLHVCRALGEFHSDDIGIG
ncbi:hypothetical protein SDC9_42744 [bioreactor metagenome]|uniref:Uncharacterized protein n=1 Tax=bioreactor metagenome TaxID=1076179 RepID=A0A644W1G0_9ZZZZ